MPKIKLSWSFWEILLFAVFTFFLIRPINNLDIWFHLKIGEQIRTTATIPTTDEFSHTALGEKIISHEWLFDLVVANIHNHFGGPGLQILVIAIILAYFCIFRLLLKNVLEVKLIPRLFFLGLLFVLGFEFWVERPQIFAYLFCMTILYVVLSFIFKNKSLLWLIPIVFMLWTNSHASMILGLYLLFSFAVLKKSKPLFLFAFMSLIITNLPPLGTGVYQLLWKFVVHRELITTVIAEWTPMWQLAERFYLFLLILAGSLTFFFISIKRKADNWQLYLPLLPLGLFILSAARQTPFSLPALLLLAVPFIKTLKLKSILYVPEATIIILTILFSQLYTNESALATPVYPEQAAKFIEKNLSGNMFNQYEVGGYLLYKLGPRYKTFIDGRTEMFIPETLYEYKNLIERAYGSDQQLITFFNDLSKRHNISFVLLDTDPYSLGGRLRQVLERSPSWKLAYIDYDAVIYTRKAL